MVPDKPYRIDVHQHIVPPEYVKALADMGVDNAIGVSFPEWSAEETLEMMDRNRIRTAMTSISAPGVNFKDRVFTRDLARVCNETAARLVEDHPKRFGAFAALPLPYMEDSLKELEYALDELKLDGVALLTNYNGRYLGDPCFEELYAELNHRNSVVFVHPTDPPEGIPMADVYPNYLVEAPFDTTRAIINLIYSGTLESCPDISFIVSHSGGTVPFLAWRISLLQFVVPDAMEKAPREAVHYLKQLYYDIALSFLPYSLRSLQELVDQSHILFGSDYPFAPEIITGQTMEGIQAYDGFDKETRQGVERDNAMWLFPRLN